MRFALASMGSFIGAWFVVVLALSIAMVNGQGLGLAVAWGLGLVLTERAFVPRGGQRGSFLRGHRGRGQPNSKFLSSPFGQIDLSKPPA